MRALSFLPLLLTAALTACGGSVDPAQALENGQSATQNADYEAALASYQDVVAAESATASQKFTAQSGVVVSEAYLHGDEAATAAFEALKKDHQDRLTIKTLEKLGQDVASSGCADTALAILAIGTSKAGDDEEQKKGLNRIAEMIMASGADDEQMAKLRSLGYIK